MSLKSRFLLLGCLLSSMSAPSFAEIKVGVISSSTGPIALVGIPQKNSIPLLPKEAAGESITYIPLNDSSDPTATVKAFKKLIDEEKVDAIIGPSGSGNAMGVIQFAAESGTPMLAPVGTAAVVLPMTEQKKWVFKTTQNDDLIASALVDHMKRTGVKTLGLIGTADPFGENWSKVMKKLASDNNIEIVANESFQRQDTSITGQSLKLLLASPDAVLIAAPGSSSVLPQTTLKSTGYQGQIYQTHGAALDPFLKLGGDAVEGTILAASLMLVLDQAPETPSKAIATKYVEDYQSLYNKKPATFGGNVFDAGLLLETAIPTALKTAKPGTPEFRAALRDALESTTELSGTQGVYNITPEDHSGFDERGRVLITVKNGKWQLLEE
ncbi:ABC transporter substrate-binding protein [Marinomonas mediterranea]|uniref:Extracellular ligand-binding receptor n=1 Tax=Marinomonas mediterranea (strain ATCC 700492 / JCM 21426 / NBRC 103028 / MMB-1) TaxID=717774 RepID=F2JV76_MARM1|nr:ABC transporter substrate-binding protein [Marinomonas mediterranea]ADZ92834.1 Extracellular ligand-binding receptor [Marinomonas mediterranea MMB-1]WCN10767.1 ABC transporter substrate-binding protein [Marinomonas mediterranea]WCN14824.1 ABC transporter substrate-binding protein [Marinomonas mediterranea]WCN18856.1 ABC transporter substrate-binding protein [Marinomonas mediterranea MMB-1]